MHLPHLGQGVQQCVVLGAGEVDYVAPEFLGLTDIMYLRRICFSNSGTYHLFILHQTTSGIVAPAFSSYPGASLG